MGATAVTPAVVTYTQQDLNDAYSTLLFDLNHAYWAASDITTKDQLYGYVEIVTGIIAHLNADDLAARDASYASVIQQVTTVNGQLKTLQQQITSLISRISTSATVISDIAKVLTVAAQLIPV